MFSIFPYRTYITQECLSIYQWKDQTQTLLTFCLIMISELFVSTNQLEENPHPTDLIASFHRLLNFDPPSAWAMLNVLKPVNKQALPIAFSGEGNGTPLQHSRLENPMDGGAW